MDQGLRVFIDCDSDPFLPEGWKVEEHKKGGQLVWDKTKISLYLSDKQKKSKPITGHDLRRELTRQPVLNACVLDYLLAHPEFIPEEWKSRAVFFWGTIYRDEDGSLCVRYLYWVDGRWGWGRHWLVSDWSGNNPAAVVVSV